jgi:gliding motility-associated-like protein
MRQYVAILFFQLLGFYVQGQYLVPHASIMTKDTVICNPACIQISAVATGTRNTYSYRFDTIGYSAQPYDSGLTVIDSMSPTTGITGGISDSLQLPFPFCFFDSSYTQCMVDATGFLTFILDFPGRGGFASPGVGLPTPFSPKLSIFAVYSSIYPFGRGSKVVTKNYGITPNQFFVASFFRLQESYAHYPPPCTFQIILYETSNVIGINYLEKPAWDGINPGLRSILGMQNKEGDSAMVVPGRDGRCCYWSAYNESWLISPTGRPHYSVTWYDALGTYVDSGLVTTVCPTASTYYIAKLVNQNCGTNDSLVLYDTAHITIVAPPILSVDSIISVSCAGSRDAAIYTHTNDGTAPFHYNWHSSSVDSLPNIMSLAGGTYSLVVSDQFSCKDTLTTEVIEPDSLSDSLLIISLGCSGVQTGSIRIFAAGGTAPYTYSLNGSPFTSISFYPFLSSGIYSIAIQDMHGCLRYDTAYLVAPPPLTITIDSVLPVSCFGFIDGVVFASAEGGAGSIEWVLDSSLISTTGIFSGLSTGLHTLYARDSFGCTSIAVAVVVSQPDSLITIVNAFPVRCNGDSSGAIVIHANGGVPPYLFNTPFATWHIDSVFAGLAAGIYPCYCMDAHGCLDTNQTIITSPTVLLLDIDSLYTPLCFDSVGSACWLNATGGISPYLFAIDDSLLSSNFEVGLPSNLHWVVVVDSNSCRDSLAVNINNPSRVIANINTTDYSCHTKGSITITATGGRPPYQYSIDAGTHYQTASLFEALDSNQYSVWVKDANGCTYSDTTMITGHAEDSFFVVLDSISCYDKNDGVIRLVNSNSGDVIYQFKIDTNNLMNQNGIFMNVSTGWHEVYWTDSSGACSDSIMIFMPNPAPLYTSIVPDTIYLQLGDTMAINTLVTNGTNLTFMWTPSWGLSCNDCPNPIVSAFLSEVYELTVFSHRYDWNDTSCNTTERLYVLVTEHRNAYIPNAFTPNNDGTNDVFKIYGQDIKTVYLSIFDRFGEKLFDSNTQENGWNGIYKNKLVEAGVYIYEANIEYLDTKKEILKGSVTLIR